jgi:CheY-like chemotaxis protein
MTAIALETSLSRGRPIDLPIAEDDRPVALVIEDDPETRSRLAMVLRADGWSVREARDGESGVLLARECVPDVILLDLALPRMSGLDALRTLKSWPDQPTRVVVVSFYAMLMRLPDLQLAEGTVQKPFRRDELLSAVHHTAAPRSQVPRSVSPRRMA